ncbi:hypothetical protein T484DRAFT_2781385 [Baffinella frigidus]|nr:hypothetical protein T484DRAFT_2781385 [Cryptophyta sp. CCMP2293]
MGMLAVLVFTLAGNVLLCRRLGWCSRSTRTTTSCCAGVLASCQRFAAPLQLGACCGFCSFRSTRSTTSPLSLAACCTSVWAACQRYAAPLHGTFGLSKYGTSTLSRALQIW